MLAEHGHLPQGLVGESVEVVGTVLPSAPALLPACVHQLLYKQAWNPARVTAAPGHPADPTALPRPLAGTWEVLHQADGLWRTGLALTGGAGGVTQQGCFLPGAAVILIGHLSTHTGPATQRTERCQGQQGVEVDPPTPRLHPNYSPPRAPVTTYTCEADLVPCWRAACCHRSPQAYVAVPSTVKWGRSRYSFGLEYSFPIHVSAWLTTRSSILQEPVLRSLPQARRSESLPRIVALKSSGPSTQFAPLH